MQDLEKKAQMLVRRSKLYVPVNREKYVAKAWTRGADCIILDLEDSIPPAEKAFARKLVKDAIPIVNKGGAEVQVRINREFAEEYLEAIIFPGLTSVMIPKCESAEEIQALDKMVTTLERDRGIPANKIQFDLITETARGVIHVEEIAQASLRTVQMEIGQVDLTLDMSFTRSADLNFEQFFYATNKLLFAARAANVQACGLTPQNNIDFTDISINEDARLQACRRSYRMGFWGAATIHPGWCQPMNEGFKPSPAEAEIARRIKAALEEAYAKGEGSVKIDGRMYDVANLKQVEKILERAQAIARREAEKAAFLSTAGEGIRP